MSSGNPVPTQTDPVLLDLQVQPLLDCLSTSETTRIEARTRAVRLITTGNPHSAILTENHHVSMPAMGLTLNSRQVRSIHSVADESSSSRRFEFDFHQGDRRLDIAVQDPMFFHSLTACFGDRRIPAADLEARRRAARPAFRICPCCRQAAVKRAAEPEKHPLSGILKHAIDHGVELQFRIDNSAFTLSTLIRPDSIEHTFGLIRVKQGQTASFLACLSLAHCLRLRIIRVDGGSLSEVAGYDMHGNQTFALSSTRADIMRTWTAICDSYFEA